MKNFALTFLLTILFIGTTFAQDSCSKFYPLKEGSSFEYTNTDKKGKIDGTINYTISDVHSDGSATVATFNLNLKDKKGKELFETNYSFSCENGLVKVDYKSLFPSQMMKQYTEMGLEMDITGTDIELPNDLSVGQELPDANVTVAMSMAGINMNVSVSQTNRKVEKKESVTTSAGTFDCYVLSENSTSKAMGANFEFQTKTWLAEGVGMIKSETYKKNGNLESKSELTKYSK
ncbi:hypothetical protein JQC67_06080 [Aurantibacter crassamenti]|uniref:TapB family protein n=1 Tax=Aurantibacter crassamenti TaxID=1837375 RepID=UPI0019394CE2|nr:hypothetical protein [Aurantibacter crassamenti]MBM1105706.1 hypothetical protein [Aurantibacter crassamenti]